MNKNYNPGNVSVESFDGYYMCYKEDILGNREPIYVPSPWNKNYQNIYDWLIDLDDSQLEAAAQIFFDRWNFSNGIQKDKMILDKGVMDSIEEERKRRKSTLSSFSPGSIGNGLKNINLLHNIRNHK
jgi:hypothetical protein